MSSKKKVIQITKKKTSSKKTSSKTKKNSSKRQSSKKKSTNKNIKYPSYSTTEIKQKGLQHVIEELTNLQKSGKLLFPYKHLLMTQQEIKGRFNRLKKYKYKVIATKYRHRNKFNLPPHFLKYKGKPLLLPFKASNYENYDLISDYFQEEARMKCLRFREQHTPYQYFENELPNVIKKAHSQYGKVDVHSMREAIFELSNECSSFRPTVIVSVIQMFKSKCLLDISSGWGDRLIGAMASDVDFYFGCDPNPDLHAGYQEMIRFFGKDKKKFQIAESPFEKANIPDKPYDLIMTSPPYFDIEIYRPDDPRQSVYQKNLQSWLHSFMFVALKKAWDKLIVGGYLVLNINNKGNKDRMVEPIIYFMNKMSNADYYGCISYGEFKGENVRNPQPMWIWRKTHKDLKRKRIVGGANSKKITKKKSDSRKSVSRVNYNPPFIVRPAYISKEDNTESATKSIKINVLRDDLLEAGTKQRAMIPYLAKHKSTEFVYVSPFTGSAQITLSYASLITGKKVTVYMDKRRPRHPLTVKALSYGVLNLVEVPNGNFKKLNKMAQDYVDLVKKEKGEDYITLFSLGFTNDEYINLLAKQIKEALPQEMLDNPPERFWVPTGSTAMVNALYKVLPTTHFFVVQTGKTVWDDQLDLTRTTVYRSEEFFYHHAKEQPPFPTTKAYDAKAWTFVKRFAKDGDYLINITRDPDLKKLSLSKRNKSKKQLSKRINISKKTSGKKTSNKKTLKKKNNAIFMLCMLKDHYVLGACIAAFTHKQFINKLNLNVNLVIMCDDYIYNKYNNLLKNYFDRVIKIKLVYHNLKSDYQKLYYINNKYTWINLSLSKWECLQFEEYNKILFLDIDILPIKEKFYNLFNFNTPAFHNVKIENKCLNNKGYNNTIKFSYNDYINSQFNNIGSIDGGLCLLKPSKKTYNDYKEFSNNIYKNGIYSHNNSGPDETSLFYFFNKKNINLYKICTEYGVIPWDDKINLLNKAKGINFLSWIKPWKKPLFFCWNEESMWRDIYNLMPHNNELKKLLKKVLIEYLNEYTKLSKQQKIRFNNKRVVSKYKSKINKILKVKKYKFIKNLENKIKFKNYGIINKNKIKNIENITT